MDQCIAWLVVLVAVAVVVVVPGMLIGLLGYAVARWLDLDDEQREWASVVLTLICCGVLFAPGIHDLGAVVGAAFVLGLVAVGTQATLHARDDKPLRQTLQAVRTIESIRTATEQRMRTLGEEHTRRTRDIRDK